MANPNYNYWQRKIAVINVDHYDYYITINGKRVGAPMDRKVVMQLAGWFPGAMEDILTACEAGTGVDIEQQS